MPGENYFLITALPALGEPGSPPPMTARQFIEHLAEAGGLRAPVEMLLLADDLLQREAILAGEIEWADPSILTEAQLRDEQPLPETVAAEPASEEGLPRIVSDRLWESFFRRAADVARRTGSRFLAKWVGVEVALRNALAADRARVLGLEAADYQVATDLASDEDDFDSLLSEWSAAQDPLAGLRVLDRARWAWLTTHDKWFTFADDELAAYAAKLLLLLRWQRIADAGRATQTGQTPRRNEAEESRYER